MTAETSDTNGFPFSLFAKGGITLHAHGVGDVIVVNEKSATNDNQPSFQSANNHATPTNSAFQITFLDGGSYFLTSDSPNKVATAAPAPTTHPVTIVLPPSPKTQPVTRRAHASLPTAAAAKASVLTRSSSFPKPQGVNAPTGNNKLGAQQQQQTKQLTTSRTLSKQNTHNRRMTTLWRAGVTKVIERRRSQITIGVPTIELQSLPPGMNLEAKSTPDERGAPSSMTMYSALTRLNSNL